MAVIPFLKNVFGVNSDVALNASDIEFFKSRFKANSFYGILFTARSGSTFLTHELHRAGVFGNPHEWFNWSHVESVVQKNKALPLDYIVETVTANSSQNGVFGFEINWLQYQALEAIVDPIGLFGRNTRWFFLRRRNLVAQAVSNFIADQSKVFHSYQLDENTLSKIKDVVYDSTAIKKYIVNFCNQEKCIQILLMKNRKFPINLYYEDLVARTSDTVCLFANAMGVDIPDSYVCNAKLNPIKKVSTEKNQEFEMLFRETESVFMDEMLAKRPSVLVESERI